MIVCGPRYKKRCDLGERDVQDSGQARHPTARDKGKEPIVPDDVDTPVDDELSIGSLPNLSPTKSSRVELEALASPCIQQR